MNKKFLNNAATAVGTVAKVAALAAPLMVRKLPRSASVAVLATLTMPTGIATAAKVLPTVATVIKKAAVMAAAVEEAEEATTNTDA